MYTYSEATGFGPLNMLSFVGAGVMAIGFALIVYNVYYSIRYSPRNISADPWDARTLEWATHTQYQSITLRVYHKWNLLKHSGMRRKKVMNYSQENIEKIHMPNNSGVPFIMSAIFFVWGFSFVFSIWIPADYYHNRDLCMYGIIVHLKKIDGHYISVKEIEETETKLRGAK